MNNRSVSLSDKQWDNLSNGTASCDHPMKVKVFINRYCMISLEAHGQVAFIKNCGHSADKNHLDTWLREHRTCMACRGIVEEMHVFNSMDDALDALDTCNKASCYNNRESSIKPKIVENKSDINDEEPSRMGVDTDVLNLLRNHYRIDTNNTLFNNVIHQQDQQNISGSSTNANSRTQSDINDEEPSRMGVDTGVLSILRNRYRIDTNNTLFNNVIHQQDQQNISGSSTNANSRTQSDINDEEPSRMGVDTDVLRLLPHYRIDINHTPFNNGIQQQDQQNISGSSTNANSRTQSDINDEEPSRMGVDIDVFHPHIDINHTPFNNVIHQQDQQNISGSSTNANSRTQSDINDEEPSRMGVDIDVFHPHIDINHIPFNNGIHHQDQQNISGSSTNTNSRTQSDINDEEPSLMRIDIDVLRSFRHSRMGVDTDVLRLLRTHTHIDINHTYFNNVIHQQDQQNISDSPTNANPRT